MEHQLISICNPSNINHRQSSRDISSEKLFQLDSSFEPVYSDFYLTFLDGNRNIQQQQRGLALLEKLPPHERAVLPLFPAACPRYTQLVLAALCDTSAFYNSDKQGKIFINLTQSIDYKRLEQYQDTILETIKKLNTENAFAKIDLSGMLLSGFFVGNWGFTLNLSQAKFTFANLDKAILHNMDLSYANFDFAILTNVDFGESDIRNASANHADLDHAFPLETIRTNSYMAAIIGSKKENLDNLNATDEYFYKAQINRLRLNEAVTLVPSYTDDQLHPKESVSTGKNLNDAKLKKTNVLHTTVTNFDLNPFGSDKGNKTEVYKIS